MSRRKQWPQYAEWARMDVIALAHSNQMLAIEIDAANRDGDKFRVAELNKKRYENDRKIQQLMIEARQSDEDGEDESTK